MTRRVHLALAPLLIALALPPVVSGNTPVSGHDDRYPHPTNGPQLTLDFHFADAYPSWFSSTVTATLEVGWSRNPDPQPGETEPPRQNSRIPRFSDGNDATGGGTIFYVNDGTSPCTGDTTWIGCNPNTPGSRNGYEIHVRLLPSQSAPTWMWFHRDDTCADVRDDGYSTSVCFSVRRVVVHEALHNTLTRNHDSQGGEDSRDTVMHPRTPTRHGSPDYWNTDTFLRCDLAGALLEYGVLDRTAPYPNCFATDPGEGDKGLHTRLTVAATSYQGCANGGVVTVRGRFALQDDWPNYRYLADTPLAGRTIAIFRKLPSDPAYPSTPYTTVTAGDGSGNNWSKGFSSQSSGTWQYRAQWTKSASEYALNTSNAVTWTMQWTTSGCATFAASGAGPGAGSR
jgi:hypothetical protein